MTDVLIVGAGPAGSATAFHLASAGFQVLLVDRAEFPRDKACAEYLSPAAVRHLDRIGVVEPLVAAGAQPLHGTTVVGPKGARLTGLFPEDRSHSGPTAGLSVSRRVLDARLVQAAQGAGAALVERLSVEDLVHDGGGVAGVIVRDATGARRAIPARLTIGADGLHSVVARRLGRRRHRIPRRVAFVGHLTGVAGLSATAEMHVGRRGYVGLNRIGRDLANVALVVPSSRAAEARGRAREFFFATLGEFPGVGGRVVPEGLTREIMVTGPFAAWSGRVVTDGAMLVGDAADFFDPFTGDGVCAALRGAELAAETIRRAFERPGRPNASRLAEYVSARRRAFWGKWAVERMIGHAMELPGLFDRAVSRLGRRRGMADTLIGVTGAAVPPFAVLNPWFLARMVL
jgi:flavin-dependent dehydrogenase